MTEEQAIEVILGGGIWEMCTQCLGTSVELDREAWYMRALNPKVCARCKGTGCRVNYIYRRACKVLKRKLPKAKFGQWQRTEQLKRALDLKPEIKAMQKQLAAALQIPERYLGLLTESEEP